MDLETSARYWANDKSVSSLALKPGMRAEVFCRTPIFGNRFIAKVVWNCDASTAEATAAERESRAADKRDKPNTVGGVWAAIHDQFEALGNLIEARRFAEVPVATAAMRDLAKMLPRLGPSPRGSHGKLTNLVALFSQWASRIDAAAAKTDRASLDANYKKLKKSLCAIASLYSPEVLKSSTMAESAPQ